MDPNYSEAAHDRLQGGEVASMDPPVGETNALDRLSPRQREVLLWVSEGKRDREIAVILGISYRTVTVHISAILEKLGVENRTCAAMIATRIEAQKYNEKAHSEPHIIGSTVNPFPLSQARHETGDS